MTPDIETPRRDGIGNTLGDYDEFHGDQASEARSRLAIPALALLVGAAISLFFFLVLAAWGAFLLSVMAQSHGGDTSEAGIVCIGLGMLGAAYFAVIMLGAVRMRQFREFQQARAAAILGIISIFLLQLFSGLVAPFAIWAFVVMRDPNVRREFKT